MATRKTLKQKAASGMVWTALQKYSTMFIHFISGIILARLLTAYDYGCIGMLSIFMVLAEAFIDGGFGSALIQKKRPTQLDYSTIFFWNIGMAAILYVALFFAAPFISRFYGIPLLRDVLRVQGVILFIYAFNIIQKNQLRKKLNFKLLSIVTITTSVIALGITVYMAYKGYGVWALVAQNIITSAIPAYNLQSTFIDYAFYNPSTMGYYSKAHSVERLASTSISSVMTQVTYPLYAEAQDDKKQLANMIRRITMTLSYLTFPLMFILILCAKPIFVLLYSERWLNSVPYFQVLCLSGLAYCLQSVNNQSIAAVGESRAMFIWTVIKRSVGIGCMIAGLVFYGMKGMLAGVVFNSWFSYFVNISLVSKYIGYKSGDQILSIAPVAIVSVISAVASYCVGSLLDLSMYPDGIVKFVVFVLLYAAWSLIFKPEAFTYFLSIIPNRLRIHK